MKANGPEAPGTEDRRNWPTMPPAFWNALRTLAPGALMRMMGMQNAPAYYPPVPNSPLPMPNFPLQQYQAPPLQRYQVPTGTIGGAFTQGGP